MLNAEKYKDEIVSRNYSFAVTEAGNIRDCDCGVCLTIGCIFRGSRNCPRSRAEWMLSDAISQTREQALATLDEVQGHFAVDKATKAIVLCTALKCKECELDNDGLQCQYSRYNWLRENGFIK